MSHRSRAHATPADDNKYSRPQLRHTGALHNAYSHPPVHSHNNDTGLNRQQSHRCAPSEYSRQAPRPPLQGASMYTTTATTTRKSMYPHVQHPEPQRRHSHSPHNTTVARRRRQGSDYSSESDSDSENSSPPPHARLSRSNKRNSTFPPSAYHSCHPQQKQLQSYSHHHHHHHKQHHQRPYIHPAIPPTSPMIESAPPSRHSHHSHQQQITTRPDPSYEAPRYTYQPPKFEDHPCPNLNARADSWSYSTSTAPSSYSRSSSKAPSSRRGSVSMPPPASRANGQNGEAQQQQQQPGVWNKAKKVYHSKTVSNTAELALFGLLAVSKAL